MIIVKPLTPCAHKHLAFKGVSMKKHFVLGCFCLLLSHFAWADHTYLSKFQTYTQWSEHLPLTPDPDFIAFIEKPSPLTQKLREKWLYQLARNKDWATFTQYYRGSKDTTLQCYATLALYQQGKTDLAKRMATQHWLNGQSQPAPCSALFTLMLKNNEISDTMLAKRITLALNNHNVSLTSYLLKQFTPPRKEDADLIKAIHQTPSKITSLEPGPLHGEFYAYGLKQMIPHHMKNAIALFQTPKANLLMNEAQKQSFLVNLTLYKAMRNELDEPYWFAKIKPQFYDDTLVEWQIRYALIHQNWQQVIRLVSQSKNKDDPYAQYWLARALEARGTKEEANEIYQKLAVTRNYYGFLASLRIKKGFSFENEPVNRNLDTLLPYRSFTEEIHFLHETKQDWQATRRLNDFMSELPKHEKSALTYWIAHHLNWHGKAVNLSSSDDLKNQLSLRFPLAYQDTVRYFAKNYNIPPALIYAVIRQESAFRDDIVSFAGANGLMQLMPKTAMVIAKRERIAYQDKKELFLSTKNINIGTAYLRDLAKHFHGHPLLMVAAYNAGPRQVNYWIKNHPPKDIDIWIETLPWKETRNYLKNIIAFYAVYQYRMRTKPNLALFMKPLHVDK